MICGISIKMQKVTRMRSKRFWVALGVGLLFVSCVRFLWGLGVRISAVYDRLLGLKIWGREGALEHG